MNGADSGAPRHGAGGRSGEKGRPGRLSSAEAERLFAELLDDAIRASERGASPLSNAAIGEACENSESRVRAWRDPHAGRPMTAYRLLQLPDPVFRSVMERIVAARGAGLEAGDTRSAALLVVASMGRAQAAIAGALGVAGLAPETNDAVAGLLVAVIRDARRLLARLGGAETP